jgi:hypothetical protein
MFAAVLAAAAIIPLATLWDMGRISISPAVGIRYASPAVVYGSLGGIASFHIAFSVLPRISTTW